MNEIHEKEKRVRACARVCVCVCVCACVCACLLFSHSTVGGVSLHRRACKLPSEFRSLLSGCSLRPGSGCRLRSEERDASEEHEFSHIVLSAARPAASAATAVPSCSESTILPAAFGIVVALGKQTPYHHPSGWQALSQNAK